MDEAAVLRYIADTFPDADIYSSGNGTYLSCDAEKHWPNFATIVRSDEFDGEMDENGTWVPRSFSDLARPGVYRLNIGVSKATFESAVGEMKDPDHTALDQLMPHPVYATQHWVSVLNPSKATFDGTVKPLLAEAYERVARGHRKNLGRP
jgi:hypothetical protein